MLHLSIAKTSKRVEEYITEQSVHTHTRRYKRLQKIKTYNQTFTHRYLLFIYLKKKKNVGRLNVRCRNLLHACNIDDYKL